MEHFINFTLGELSMNSKNFVVINKNFSTLVKAFSTQRKINNKLVLMIWGAYTFIVVLDISNKKHIKQLEKRIAELEQTKEE